MASLRDPVDAFFAAVLVMADDPDIRKNRLTLLERISSLFDSIADFTKYRDEEAAEVWTLSEHYVFL